MNETMTRPKNYRVNFVEMFALSPLFDEWSRDFCRDCPAVTSIPKTLEAPGEEFCPCDFDPFSMDCQRYEKSRAVVLCLDSVSEWIEDELSKSAKGTAR